ncbi:hypothetical protein A0J48_008150 [Sphaerospermopsis aphanizomenoides BCCUSP55]|uniref:hypothetical protein n=1 Tax=Sphaerospermopsis aphanizomenoides TaxID=459663 RepID=UPI001903DB78|nr:hypothetical protein [Sphaerospermopsis aphanizomenoides]MBK1987508.1 hypothetical protein [Sphaerospermopsis aphanizomenoides BCCUSP55]
MLKSLLLSGWFRVQPFLKYAVVIILIAPFVGVSVHSTLAKQSQVAKSSTGLGKLDSTSTTTTVAKEPSLDRGEVNSLPSKFGIGLANTSINQEKQLLSADQVNSEVGQKNYQSGDDANVTDISQLVKLPNLSNIPVSQTNLVQKLKDAKNQALEDRVNSVGTASQGNDSLLTSTVRESLPPLMKEVPIDGPPRDSEGLPDDPMGSPHPIPWKWIMMTQEAIGGQGGSGVRYYRSIPVVSPDGRYAVYSRVQLEVNPEMHNSRVSSLLFIEDRQTKSLRVIAKTANVADPLLKQTLAETNNDTEGKIGVLVPISWSQKGDRFLARKFMGIFNTADVTDQAVIWDRQENHATTVTPVSAEDEHEKIAMLLGWSKKQPDHALFRAGELGEENWPLVQVSSDGKTVNVTTDGDKPVTYGVTDTQVWAEPQVASR